MNIYHKEHTEFVMNKGRIELFVKIAVSGSFT